MRLSRDEQTELGRVYDRYRNRRRVNGRNVMWITFVGPAGMFANEIRKGLHSSHASHELLPLCLVGGLLGAGFSATIAAAFFHGAQAKRDAETIVFFEKHFPDDCTWKQEEAILLRADELQKEARTSAILLHVDSGDVT